MICSNEEIGSRIAKLRKEYSTEDGQKLSQEKFAQAVNLSRSIIAKIEAGLQPLTPTQLYNIAAFFNVSTDYIISGLHAENVTVSRDLGLSDSAIETLKRMKAPVSRDDKEAASDVLYAVNTLLSNPGGIEVLTYISAFLNTDFCSAVVSVEITTVDNAGKATKTKISDYTVNEFRFKRTNGGYYLCTTDELNNGLLNMVNLGLQGLRSEIIRPEMFEDI